MTMDDILDALVSAMQADTALASVSAYHKVEGMVPGVKPTVSVWIEKPKYKPYDNSMDEAEVPIHIGITVKDMQAERGEQVVRGYAEEIRMLCTADQRTLGGLIDDSFFESWEFESVKSEQFQLLHLAEGIWNVCYYAPRARTVAPVDPMDELDFTESIITETETIGG